MRLLLCLIVSSKSFSSEIFSLSTFSQKKKKKYGDSGLHSDVYPFQNFHGCQRAWIKVSLCMACLKSCVFSLANKYPKWHSRSQLFHRSTVECNLDTNGKVWAYLWVGIVLYVLGIKQLQMIFSLLNSILLLKTDCSTCPASSAPAQGIIPCLWVGVLVFVKNKGSGLIRHHVVVAYFIWMSFISFKTVCASSTRYRNSEAKWKPESGDCIPRILLYLKAVSTQ